MIAHSQHRQFGDSENLNHTRNGLNPAQYRENPLNEPKVQMETAETYLKQGDSFRKEGKLEESLQCYQKAIKLDSENWLAFHQLGDCYFQKEDWEKAVSFYKSAIRFNSNFHWSYCNLGRVLYLQGKAKEAAAFILKAVEIDPDFTFAHLHLSQVFLSLKEWSKAIEVYHRILDKFPENLDAIQGLSLAFYQKSQWDLEAAIQGYQKAIQLNPMEEKNYYKLLEIKSDDFNLYVGLAKCLAKKTKWKKSIYYYRKALELKPNDPEILSLLEKVSAKVGRVKGVKYEDPAITSQADLVCFDWDTVSAESKNRSSELYSVDIIVCVHNALEDVKNCLTSIINHTHVEYHVIVVDDGSETETEEFLKTWVAQTDRTTLLRNSTARGYTKAANQGLRASGGDYAILLNSDTIATPRWIEKMVECAKSDEKIGVVGPLSNCASWQSVPELFSPKGDWMINQIPEGYSLDQFSQLVEKLSIRGFPQVNFVNGFCYMMTRAVINAVGLLDEASFPHGYGEENDFSLRVSQAGFKLAIADHAYVYHAKSKSFGHQRRKELAKQGSKVLKEKHPQADLKVLTDKIKNSQPLQQLRSRLQEELNENQQIL